MRIVAFLVALHAGVVLAGDTWVALTPITSSMGSSIVVADVSDPETIYANAFARAGIGKSIDGGKTWSFLPLPITPFDVLRKIIVERSAPNHLTVMVWDNQSVDVTVCRSADGGLTWVAYRFTPPIAGVMNDLAVDPIHPNTLYAAHARSCFGGCISNSGGVAKSVDGGRHWTALFNGMEIEQVLVDPFGSATIYAVGDVSRRSQDGGATWTDLHSIDGQPLSIFRIAADPIVPDVLYAQPGAPGLDLMRSDDAGANWHHLGLPAFQSVFMAWTIAVNPVHRNVIVLGGGNGQGVLRSTDGGQTWQPLNDGLALGMLVPQSPTQLDWIQVAFSSDGSLYGAAGFHGAMILETTSSSRRHAVRH